jgi:hypothetical protein
VTVAARRRRVRATRAALVGVTGLATLAPSPARAQVTLSLDLGGATVAYDDFIRSVAASVTPSVLLERGRATFLARGAYSRFESGNESIQGTIIGSVLSPAIWKLRGEIGGTASSTRYRDVTSATNVAAMGRLHLAERGRGLWLGTGVGGVAKGFLFPDDLVELDVGGWVREDDVTFTLRFTPTRVGDVEYMDATGGLRWEGVRGEVSASAGHRTGDRVRGVGTWGEIGATLWLGRHLALVGGGGAFPSEVVRGLPGGRYASIALRIASRPPPVSDPKVIAQQILPYELRGLRERRNSVVRAFNVAHEPDGTRTLRIRVPGARVVELMADFTDWTPVQLSREDEDLWALNVYIAPGVHRLSIRVDGAAWAPPPGLTQVSDDYGGQVGLLVVR